MNINMCKQLKLTDSLSSQAIYKNNLWLKLIIINKKTELSNLIV